MILGNFYEESHFEICHPQNMKIDSQAALQRFSFKKVFLKIYSKFTGEHPCRRAISINLQSKFIEIALRHGCSPVNLLYIFKDTFLKEYLWRAACER